MRNVAVILLDKSFSDGRRVNETVLFYWY